MEFKSTWTEIHNLFITPFYLPERDSFSVVLLPIQGLPVSYAAHCANVKLIHLRTSSTIYTSSYKFGDTEIWWYMKTFEFGFQILKKRERNLSNISKPEWIILKARNFFFFQYWNTSCLVQVRTRRTVGLHLAPGCIKDMNLEMLESHSVWWEDHSEKGTRGWRPVKGNAEVHLQSHLLWGTKTWEEHWTNPQHHSIFL